MKNPFKNWFGLANDSLIRNYQPRRTDPNFKHMLDLTGLKPADFDCIDPIKISTVYACIQLLAKTVASLPCKIVTSTVHSELGDVSDEVVSDLTYLVKHLPNTDVTAFEFWQAVIIKLCLYGNAFVEIKRNQRDKVIALKLIDDNLCLHVERNDKILVTEQRTYLTRNLIHFRNMWYKGFCGISPIEILSDTLKTAQRVQKTTIDDVDKIALLKIPERAVKESQIVNLRLQLNELGYNTIALERDLELVFQQGKTAVESNIKTINDMTVDDICRVFGVPVNLITGQGITQNGVLDALNRQLLQYTINPMLIHIEQELNAKLLNRFDIVNGVSFKFNRNAVLQADYRARAEFYKTMAETVPDIYNTNYIKRLEDIQ